MDSKLTIKEKADLLCGDCFRYDGGANPSCFAYEEFYFLWSDHCRARETNPHKWLKNLRELEASGTGQVVPIAYRRNAQQALLERMRDMDTEIREVYYQESHGRDVKKRGGGDKADRTHKLFGKQRMKDNRPIYEWEGFLPVIPREGKS